MSKLMTMLALESSNTKPNVETEAVIFAKVMHPEGLAEAVYKEHHEQLEADMGTKGRCRVRKVSTEQDVRYEFVIKVPNGQIASGVKSSIESKAILVDEVFFENFRMVAKKMLRKTRFVFDGHVTPGGIGYARSSPPPGVKYEVDIFETQSGKMSEWAKIDIELDNLLAFINSPTTIVNDDRQIRLTFKVSHLPFKPEGGFLTSQATPEQKTLLDELWDQHFNLDPNWKAPVQSVVQESNMNQFIHTIRRGFRP